MAFLDLFNRGKIRDMQQQIQQLANHAIYDWWLTEGVPNYLNDDPHEYLEKGFMGNTSVYGLINRIDFMRKQAMLRLVDKDGKDIEKHELLRFLKKVNNNLSTDDFISQLLIYRLSIGEFFIYKPAVNMGINAGKVGELTPLPSADVEIIEGDFLDPVRGYKIEGNYNIELTKENTYHHKIFNPNWFYEKSLHGMSPLRAAAKTVSKLNQIEITESKGFENQGPPYILFKKSKSGVANPADRLTDPQRNQIEKQFKKATNENNRGLPLIMKDEYDKLDLGQTFADLKTVESSDAGMIALCNVYAFPPELAGYGQKTYSNMATARKAAWTDCIMPNLAPIEDTFNHCLIDPVPAYKNSGIRFKFDFSEVEELSEGMGTKVTWMVQAGLSGNEIREAVNQPRSENPLMDEPRISMGTGFISDYADPLQGNKSFEDYLDEK